MDATKDNGTRTVSISVNVIIWSCRNHWSRKQCASFYLCASIVCVYRGRDRQIESGSRRRYRCTLRDAQYSKIIFNAIGSVRMVSNHNLQWAKHALPPKPKLVRTKVCMIAAVWHSGTACHLNTYLFYEIVCLHYAHYYLFNGWHFVLDSECVKALLDDDNDDDENTYDIPLAIAFMTHTRCSFHSVWAICVPVYAYLIFDDRKATQESMHIVETLSSTAQTVAHIRVGDSLCRLLTNVKLIILVRRECGKAHSRELPS